MAIEERFLTMTEVADLLRIEGDRRHVRAWRQLRRLEKANGVSILIDAKGKNWLTTRTLIEDAIPALRSRRTRMSALSNVVKTLSKDVQSLRERVDALE